MKKFVRFAGVALLALTIGVVGCDDDAAPVAPVAPPTPVAATPPLMAEMSPTSHTIGVGGTVIFAVSVSGGAAGAEASWDCRSSDPRKATVSDTPAGCEVTAVAVGGVSIIAVVTKGGETVNKAAGLTITEDVVEQARVFVSSIEGSEANDDVLSGRVTVKLNVEFGDQAPMQLSVLVDGLDGVVVAATLPFSARASAAAAVAAPEGEEGEEGEREQQQAVHPFELSFDSDEYNEVTGEPTYVNGDYTIQAALMVAGSDEPVESGIHDREFGNDDGYVVTVDLGDNSAIGADGRRWYGGPGNGTIDITALPVSYTGGSVTSVGANFCGEDATDSDGSDGYTFEFDCEDKSGEQTISVSSAGAPGTILDAADIPAAYIDMVGPEDPPTILANPNGRRDGWINAAVSLTAEWKKAGDDALLVKGAEDEDEGGVGGYNMGVQVGATLKAALAAAVASGLPAESSAADSYCAIAVATDDLGNLAAVPDTTFTCRVAPEGTDVLVDLDNMPLTDGVYGYDSNADNNPMVTEADVNLSGQTLEFGVDNTAPGIELVMAEPRFDDTPEAIVFETYDDENAAGNSGLVGTTGLFASASRRTASKTDCPVIAAGGTISNTDTDKDCGSTAISSDEVAFGAGLLVGYYTVSAVAKDKAGNSSGSVGHTLVYDNDGAKARAPVVPFEIAAGEPFQGTTYLNDNLSIRDYYGTMNYGTTDLTALRLGIGAPIPVDGFNATSFTRLNHSVTQAVGLIMATGVVEDPYAAIQTSQGDDRQLMTGVSVFVRDQAQDQYNDGMSTTTMVSPTGFDVLEDSLGWQVSGTDMEQADYTVALQGLNTNNTYEVCGYAACANTDKDNTDESTLKIELRADKIQAGTFRDPIERVDFWVTDINGASWRIGSDTSGTSGRVGGENNSRFRTSSYSMTVSGTLLKMASRPLTGGMGTVVIRAVAVNEHGAALVVSTSATNGINFGMEDEN